MELIKDNDHTVIVKGLMPKGWPDLIINRRKTGWRLYWRHSFTGYNGSNWGQGATGHDRLQAVRSALNGQTLGAFATPELAAEALEHEEKFNGLMPA